MLDAVRTLDANLRQKPVYVQELASLAAQRKKKEDDEHRIRNALARSSCSMPEEFAACEKENAGLQKVQLRFIELGKKIGQGITVQQHLDGLAAKIAGRTAGTRTTRRKRSRPRPSTRRRQRNTTHAIAETDAALGTRRSQSPVQRDLRFTEEKIAEYKTARSRSPHYRSRPGNSATRSRT